MIDEILSDAEFRRGDLPLLKQIKDREDQQTSVPLAPDSLDEDSAEVSEDPIVGSQKSDMSNGGILTGQSSANSNPQLASEDDYSKDSKSLLGLNSGENSAGKGALLLALEAKLLESQRSNAQQQVPANPVVNGGLDESFHIVEDIDRAPVFESSQVDALADGEGGIKTRRRRRTTLEAPQIESESDKSRQRLSFNDAWEAALMKLRLQNSNPENMNSRNGLFDENEDLGLLVSNALGVPADAVLDVQSVPSNSVESKENNFIIKLDKSKLTLTQLATLLQQFGEY